MTTNKMDTTRVSESRVESRAHINHHHIKCTARQQTAISNGEMSSKPRNSYSKAFSTEVK